MGTGDILAVLERVAPVSLSDEFCRTYKLYDNSGVIIDSGNGVTGALFALDLSPQSAGEAVARGYNLIVTHHPAIYGGISRIDAVGDPQGKALAACLKHGVSVISMHLNFDAAPMGIDFHLMRGLGGRQAKILAPVDGGGYGRAYSVPATPFKAYIEHIKREFCTQNVFVFCGGTTTVERVASFCGAGCDEKAIAFAAEHNADVFVSADMKHHEITALLGRGISVVQLTHYASENYGFEKIYGQIKDSLGVPSAYFTDGRLL